MQYILAYRIRISLVIIIGFLFLSQTVTSQNVVKADSVSIPGDTPVTITAREVIKADSISTPKHSAHKATIYSIVLPGLGQAYNRKYWKIPVIYAGFGALAYFIHTNNKQYLEFKDAYSWRTGDTSAAIPNQLAARYKNPADLLTGMNYYRRNLEVSVMLTAVLYILNVVDAAVDAHLFDFNISDDLSLHVQPFLNPSPLAAKQSGGLRLSLSF